MMLKPSLSVAPAANFLTLAEVKTQLRIGATSDYDDMLNRLIEVAQARLDGYSGILARCLITQTWVQPFNGWSRKLELPFPDVSAITSLKYFDEDNVEQTVAPSNYSLVNAASGPYVRLNTDYSTPSLYDEREDRINITFTAGYGALAAAVPAPIKHAAYMLIDHWWLHRDALSVNSSTLPVPEGVYALLEPYRAKLS
jgi:uncharacterized phiE125 gp8 family phage protein